MSTILQQRFERWKTRCNIPANEPSINNFQNIIGLTNIIGGNYDICVSNHFGYLIICIRYTHTQHSFDLVNNNIRELSPEINHAISEYLPSCITLNIRIDYPNNYPFDEPKWSLVSCDDRLFSSLKNAEEYYKYIINIHNKMNKSNWSPSTNIDADLLVFIVRINHFDCLFI